MSDRYVGSISMLICFEDDWSGGSSLNLGSERRGGLIATLEELQGFGWEALHSHTHESTIIRATSPQVATSGVVPI